MRVGGRRLALGFVPGIFRGRRRRLVAFEVSVARVLEFGRRAAVGFAVEAGVVPLAGPIQRRELDPRDRKSEFSAANQLGRRGR